MSEWQPIDTAPKDGTEVLLYGMAWDDAAKGGFYAVGFWRDDKWMDDPDDTEGWHLNTPTHWQPLPPPPTT